MNPEQKAAHDELMTQIKSQIEKSIAEKNEEGAKTLKALQDRLEAAEKDAKEYEALKKEHVQLMADIKAMKEKPAGKVKANSIIESLTGVKDQLATLKEKKGSDINLMVKAATTMTTGNVTPTTAGGLSVVLNDPEAGITPVPRSAPFFRQLFPSAPTSGNTVSYAEFKNPDGGAGMTAEGAAKTQADFDVVEAKANVRKITSYIKTSKEALDDIEALSGEINNELLTLVALKADSQLMSGDNTGQNLNGVLTQAQTFTGGDLAGTIDNANNFDVLTAAIVEVQTAEVVTGEPAGFMPNVIVMNPVDVAAMKLTKDTTGNYVFPVTLPGATTVLEVPVISNARMTAGDFLVMDSTKGNLRIREDVSINIGYENDDFTKNLVTILAEMRLAFYIKSQHVKAFVKGTFTTAKALLETV